MESYIPNGGSYAQGDAQALHIGEDGLEATQAARRQNMVRDKIKKNTLFTNETYK